MACRQAGKQAGGRAAGRQAGRRAGRQAQTGKQAGRQREQDTHGVIIHPIVQIIRAAPFHITVGTLHYAVRGVGAISRDG